MTREPHYFFSPCQATEDVGNIFLTTVLTLPPLLLGRAGNFKEGHVKIITHEELKLDLRTGL